MIQLSKPHESGLGGLRTSTWVWVWVRVRARVGSGEVELQLDDIEMQRSMTAEICIWIWIGISFSYMIIYMHARLINGLASWFDLIWLFCGNHCFLTLCWHNFNWDANLWRTSLSSGRTFGAPVTQFSEPFVKGLWAQPVFLQLQLNLRPLL